MRDLIKGLGGREFTLFGVISKAGAINQIID